MDPNPGTIRTDAPNAELAAAVAIGEGLACVGVLHAVHVEIIEVEADLAHAAGQRPHLERGLAYEGPGLGVNGQMQRGLDEDESQVRCVMGLDPRLGEAGSSIK